MSEEKAAEATVAPTEAVPEATPQATPQATPEETSSEVKEEIKDVVAEKAKEDPLSSRFALLTRKEKELREREQAAKNYESKVKELEEIIGKSKESPIAALQAAGYTYEQATNYILNDQKPTEDMVRQKESDRLAKLEERLTERERAEAQAKYNATVESYKESIGGYLGQKEDEYPLIASLKDKKEVVYDVVDSHYRTTGNVLSLDEACAYIEDSFKGQFESFISTDVGRELAKKYLGVAGVETPKEESKAMDSNTLTNKASTTSPTPRERQLTTEESIAQAAKLLRFADH